MLISSEVSAYFDVSGHPDDQPLLAIAGFLASRDQWLQFDREWKFLLSEAGTDLFHMTDFERGRPPFDTWSKKSKRKFLERIILAINTNTIRHFCQGIRMKDYREINDIYLLQEFLGTPYAILGRTIFGQLREWNAQNQDCKTLTFFEKGTKHQGDLDEVAKRDGFSPIFLAKKEKKEWITPFQAADVLAWELFNAIRTYSPHKQNLRESFQNLAFCE